MLRGLFGGGRKQERQQSKVDPFGTISGAAPRTAVEYRGTLPATKGVTHYLFCSEISKQDAAALLDQGFKPIVGVVPAFSIKCMFALAKDAGQLRTLFDLYVDLETLPSIDWQRWVVVQTCQGLKKRLLTCTERSLLIRCKNEHEFPFCIDSDTLDFAWLDDGNRYLRSALAEYEAIRQV